MASMPCEGMAGGGGVAAGQQQRLYILLLLYFYSIFYAYAHLPPSFLLFSTFTTGWWMIALGEADMEMELEAVEGEYLLVCMDLTAI